MNRLFIDTSVGRLSFAVKKDDEVAFLYQLDNPKLVAEDMIKMIRSALLDQSIYFNQLDEIYVTKGPGSYTGERLGLTFAKTYALLNKNVKIYTGTSLEMLIDKNYLAFAILDARNDACFGGLYDHGKLISEIKRYTKEEVLDIIKNNPEINLYCPYFQMKQLQERYNHKVNYVYINENMLNNIDLFVLEEYPINMVPIYLKGE